jgi:MFS family permease
VSAYPAWTPAPRPGIVPLHPYGFGTTLGRSFTALRQNPGVLLGFALGVQALAYVVLLLATGATAFATFSRLDTVTPGTDEYEAITAGSVAITAVVGGVLSLLTGALTVIVQGVVVTEVAGAVVAERRTLAEIWRRVKPVAWRLVGYSFLVLAVLLVVGAIVAGLIIALGLLSLPAAIVLGILAVLAAIPLTAWLSTKLVLVPAVILLERATIRAALGRSWQLTRRRFWPTFGVLVIISFTFSTVAQIVGIPLQFVAIGFTTVLAPTGDPDTGALIGFVVVNLLTQLVTLLVQCVALIVQSTAVALVYVDSRMRHEGLDLDLTAYVERRDAGEGDLADPYLAHIGRAAPPRFAPPVFPPPSAYPAGYPAAPPPSPPASPAYAPAPLTAPPAPTEWAPPAAPPRADGL